MTVTKNYELVGKYRKLFDAKRGKFSLARSSAIFEISNKIPTVESYDYLSCIGRLTITYTQNPSYLVEDDIFDIFEQHYQKAVAK
jgi:hypothetical protein